MFIDVKSLSTRSANRDRYRNRKNLEWGEIRKFRLEKVWFVILATLFNPFWGNKTIRKMLVKEDQYSTAECRETAGFLCGYLKEKVYVDTSQTLEQLKENLRRDIYGIKCRKILPRWKILYEIWYPSHYNGILRGILSNRYIVLSNKRNTKIYI